MPKNVSYFFEASTDLGSRAYKLKGDYFEKLLAKGSDDYKVFEALFSLRLDGAEIVKRDCIASVYSVFNPELAKSFDVTNKSIAKRLRTQPTLFKKDDWKSMDRFDLREWTKKGMDARIASYPWNQNTEEGASTVLALHGTDASIARNIIDGGFSALSTVDAGYYGSGMYFTSSAVYGLPYYGTKKKPSLLICLLTPGNSFPVVESREEDKSFLGVPIRSGYQSHCVNVTLSGEPCAQVMTDDFYDEIVVGQELQILPVYLVEFDPGEIVEFSLEISSRSNVAMPDPSTRAEFNITSSRTLADLRGKAKD